MPCHCRTGWTERTIPLTVRPGRKRELAAQLSREWDVSIRRACRVLEFDTSTYHYKARRGDQAGIEARIRDMCQTRVRYGYRRIRIFLGRESYTISAGRMERLWRQARLQVPRKRPRKRWRNTLSLARARLPKKR